MRVLFYSDQPELNENQLLMQRLIDTKLAIIDDISDVLDAEYHLYVREYDLVVIDSSESFGHLATLLKMINTKHKENPFLNVVLNRLTLSEAQIKQYLKFNYYSSSKISDVSTHLEKLYPFAINRDGVSVKINGPKLEIVVKQGRKRKSVSLSKIEFRLVVYFLRHYNEKVHMDRLLSAISDEPEYTGKTTIETAISKIKQKFQKGIQVTPITNFKKVGYLFQV